jgi:dolichol kinase
MSFLIGLILGLALALPLMFVAIALVAMIWGDDEEKK